MNSSQKLHQARLNEWTIRFKDQKASGLTIRQWCEDNQISIHAYNYWKHLLKSEVVDQMLPDIAPLPVPVSQNAPSQLPETHLANCPIRVNCAASTLVAFKLNGTLIEIADSVPEHFLKTLVRVVQNA